MLDMLSLARRIDIVKITSLRRHLLQVDWLHSQLALLVLIPLAREYGLLTTLPHIGLRYRQDSAWPVGLNLRLELFHPRW